MTDSGKISIDISGITCFILYLTGERLAEQAYQWFPNVVSTDALMVVGTRRLTGHRARVSVKTN